MREKKSHGKHAAGSAKADNQESLEKEEIRVRDDELESMASQSTEVLDDIPADESLKAADEQENIQPELSGDALSTRGAEPNASLPIPPTGAAAYRRDTYGSGPYSSVSSASQQGEFNSDNSPMGFVTSDYEVMKAKKRRRGLRAFGISVGVLFGLVAIAYVVGAVIFMGRFLPNTVLGEHDISFKSDQEVANLLDGIVKDYHIDVLRDGFSYRASGEDIGLSIDSQGILSNIHSDLNAWKWPLLLLEGRHDETEHLSVKFSPSTYEKAVDDALAHYNQAATPPTNATIVYNKTTDKFEVQPEQQGTQLHPPAVLASIAKAISALETKVLLDDENLVKPTIYSTDQKLLDAAQLATGMVAAKLSLVMGGQVVGEVNGDSLSDFITINENYEVVFRDEEMNAWVENLALSFDTVGTERFFTRADGKQVTVPAGRVYGWEVDSETLKATIIENVKAGTVGQVAVPCFEEAAVYAGPHGRDWGPRYIDVDLSEQYVRFYGEDGAIIWEAPCITGTPDGEHDTGVGAWYVNNKESPSKLIGYERGKKIYETTVKYWMAFEYNGIGFHDATWQPSFGGNMYARGYGSHGCVNLSYSAAESLYGIIQIGDPVMVHW